MRYYGLLCSSWNLKPTAGFSMQALEHKLSSTMSDSDILRLDCHCGFSVSLTYDGDWEEIVKRMQDLANRHRVASGYVAGLHAHIQPLATDALTALILWFRSTVHPLRLCFYCGVGVRSRPYRGPHEITNDHVIPLSRKGSNGKKNRVISCRACNQRKGDRTLEEFRRRAFPNGKGEFFAEVEYKKQLPVLG